MLGFQSLDEWTKKFKAFIEHEINAQGWLDRASHLHPNKFKEIGERISKWLLEHPAPSALRMPHPPVHITPPHGQSVHGVGNMNAQIERAQFVHRMRRGQQGGSTLGAVVVLGGMTATGIALKLGVVAVKWYVEEKVWEAAERNFINPVFEAASYARMPATRSQLRYAYMQYCDFKVCSVANYGITPQLMSESDFCWMEYGVDMSVLTP